MTAPSLHEAFWRSSQADLFTRLKTGEAGLTGAEAAARLITDGPNEFAESVVLSWPRRILKRATEPLVMILIIAAFVSALTGDFAGFWMILAIITLSIALDVVQEQRAESAAHALQRTVALHADVVRDGIVRAVPATDLVRGDVVELKTGDLVPADGVVLTSQSLFVSQAQLTGEPYPSEKSVAPAQSDDVTDATNALFMGSTLTSGTARMLVVATGGATRFGEIAASLAANEPPTQFERDMRTFGLMIVTLTGALVVFVFASHLAFSRPLIDSFLFALALAVGLTPELLPMIMTVTLSRGALRLAKGGVIIKRLSALHNLGAMDVLCTDKTGTLTQAKIALVGHIREDGKEDDRVFELAYLNSHFETGVRSPLDAAILDHGVPPEAGRWTRIADVPFDFERRRVSVMIDDGTRRLLVVKGAPEDVLSHSAEVEAADLSRRPLDAAARASLQAVHDRLAADGQRLLAIAWRDMPRDAAECGIGDEQDLVFAGFAVFLDPPKPSAGLALAELGKAGVAVKIVSGDNDLVVGHLAKSLGMTVTGVLSGQDISRLDDLALAIRCETTNLFCRVDPGQKNRVIRAIQARGHVVGYLGDGINDAPSLKTADIGLSVDDAVDVAKESADLILTQPDLGMVVKAAVEGRRTFANIMKYVLMGTSSNFGNMVSMAAASLFLPFLPMLPVQILFNNLIYDASEIGVPFDHVDRESTEAPQVWDMAALRRFTLIMGLLSSVFDIATFALLRLVFEAGPALFQTAWFMESMATQILVIFVIRTRGLAFSSLPHPALALSSLGALAVALTVPFTPVGGWLGFVPIPPTLALVLAGIVVLYLALAEIAKRAARQSHPLLMPLDRLAPALSFRHKPRRRHSRRRV